MVPVAGLGTEVEKDILSDPSAKSSLDRRHILETWNAYENYIGYYLEIGWQTSLYIIDLRRKTSFWMELRQSTTNFYKVILVESLGLPQRKEKNKSPRKESWAISTVTCAGRKMVRKRQRKEGAVIPEHKAELLTTHNANSCLQPGLAQALQPFGGWSSRRKVSFLSFLSPSCFITRYNKNKTIF